MNITWEQIAKANETIGTTDIKGKDYAMVNQRVKAFRMVYPDGFIAAKIVEDDGNICKCAAEVGYYGDGGQRIVIATGTAFEVKTGSYINKTSYIENCETSAVGRALGFAGFGIDTSICSAEELTNALEQQERKDKPSAPPTELWGCPIVEEPAKPVDTPEEAQYRVKCIKAYGIAKLDRACRSRFGTDFSQTPAEKVREALPDEVVDAKIAEMEAQK